MNQTSRVAVCSRSFSQHPVLRQEVLAQFKNVTFNDAGKSLVGQELIQFLKGHDRAIIALEVIDEEVLKAVPELKVIGKYGVGLDKLDFKSMDQHQVQLGWTAGVNAQSVAELTLGMALNIVRNIHVSHELVKSGGWKQITGKQISSLTVGLLGCGHVGKKVVSLLQGFGCQILSHDILDFPEFYSKHSVKAVSFEELITSSDLLSIHVPKNPSTLGLLSPLNLDKMKKGSYLINTARGGLVVENHLLQMLNSGHLAAAAFDVFEQEPPSNKELTSHPRLYTTSHIGGSSEEAILAMGRAAIHGLNHFKNASEYEK
jgi:D-3-phosphoglycerate dehydrogenase